MSEHRIRLHGPAATPDRLSGHLYRDLLTVLVEGAERALRFQIEGRSTARGAAPRWLRPASDFALLRDPTLSASELRVEARPLFEAMSDTFRQGELFSDLDPRKSSLDLFEDALEEAIQGKEDSTRFDAGLLETFSSLGGLLDAGLTRIALVNGRKVEVDPAARARIQSLSARSHRPQAARITGVLDAIRYSDCRFTLKLISGAILNGTAIELGQAPLQAKFGKVVTITGKVEFAPAGSPLRVVAESIDEPGPNDASLWGSVPRAAGSPVDLRALVVPQGPKSGLNAILGKWPGDETDEEVMAALEEMS